MTTSLLHARAGLHVMGHSARRALAPNFSTNTVDVNPSVQGSAVQGSVTAGALRLIAQGPRTASLRTIARVKTIGIASRPPIPPSSDMPLPLDDNPGRGVSCR
jgi:hypothetical protein